MNKKTSGNTGFFFFNGCKKNKLKCILSHILIVLIIMMHNNEVESIATLSDVKEVNMAHYLGLFLLICNILFFVYSRYG